MRICLLCYQKDERETKGLKKSCLYSLPHFIAFLKLVFSLLPSMEFLECLIAHILISIFYFIKLMKWTYISHCMD